jgi:glutamate N-acetyltransferase/amino-acid N-acetyltransferase
VGGGVARTIVANSGCSNVATGVRGLRDARAMAAEAARAVGVRTREVLVASTGVIGVPLPLARIRRGIRGAAEGLASGGFPRAARAIMTTDTVPKLAAARLRIGGREVALGGIAKGSGMIEPNMATLLGFLATDAAVEPGYLARLLREVADASFNRLSVDGEGSTSDSVVCMASGAAGGRPVRAGSREAATLEAALHAVAHDLVLQLARDGEGATKLVVVEVVGARSAREADLASRRIGNSMLVKTAIFGGDPNWGRILQTIGAAGIAWNPETTRIRVGGVAVFARGRSAGPAARARAERALRDEEITIEVDLGRGRGAARLYTCDLTTDYIRINADYTT